jgi:hypothetical protein
VQEKDFVPGRRPTGCRQRPRELPDFVFSSRSAPPGPAARTLASGLPRPSTGQPVIRDRPVRP